MRSSGWLITVVTCALAANACAALPVPTETMAEPTETMAEPAETTAEPTGEPRILAVGDIADCKNLEHLEQVAELIAQSDAPVAALGDVAYPSGSVEDFETCFDPLFGSVRGRFRPVPGNHDYQTDGAAPYYDYFGAAAGTEGEGWYAYDIGSWRLVALNSNCSDVGGCGPDSAQFQWLRTELETHPDVCRIAYWHHARFTSSARHTGAELMGPIVELLDTAGTQAVLSGHVHQYERFDRLGPDGDADPDGIRFFNVGTGGARSRGFGEIAPGSLVRESDVYGVLELTLAPGELRWSFRATGGSTLDEGVQACSAAGSPAS